MENKEKLELLEQLVDGAEASLKAARQIISELSGNPRSDRLVQAAKSLNVSSGGKIIEGVFDGEHMIGPDQKKFPVPANYASKSKLIEGDVLKLTINTDGSFVFKQIKPANRKKIVGTLTYADGDYRVLADGKAYKVLFASITFHKVQPGDSVVVVVPEDNTGQWGAIENIVHPESKKIDQPEQALEEIQSGEPLKIQGEDFDSDGFKEEDADISDLLGAEVSNNNQGQNTDIDSTDEQFTNETEAGFGEGNGNENNQGLQPVAQADQSENVSASVITHNFDKEIKELEI